MNLYSAVRLSGACVAALTVGVLTSACGASSEEPKVANKAPTVSTTPPTWGLGAERMDPDPAHAVPFPDLGLVLAGPSESEARFSDGVGMFGDCVVTVTANKQVPGYYEITLVKNDKSASPGGVTDATNPEDADNLFATHQQDCTA